MKRDAVAARSSQGLCSSRQPASPGNQRLLRTAAYPVAVKNLKRKGIIRRRCRLRQCKFLNNIVEQDHRNVKRRTWHAKGYGSAPIAWRTLCGIEAMEMIRKGRARRVAKGAPLAQVKFVEKRFGIRRLIDGEFGHLRRSLDFRNGIKFSPFPLLQRLLIRRA